MRSVGAEAPGTPYACQVKVNSNRLHINNPVTPIPRVGGNPFLFT